MAVLVVFLFLIFPAQARDMTGLAQLLTPDQQNWIRGLRNKQGKGCCNDADGYDVYWRSKGDGYEVQIDGTWYDVPPHAVLEGPNRIGVARIWRLYRDGIPIIVCFLPGAGL